MLHFNMPEFNVELEFGAKNMPLATKEILEEWKRVAPYWNSLWIIEFVALWMGVYYFEHSTRLSDTQYVIGATICLILIYITFFASTITHTDGHNYKKHVLSLLGRWRVHGKKNGISALMFFLYSLSYSLMMAFISHYFTHTYRSNPLGVNLPRAGYSLYIEIIFAMMMGSIPLDVERWKHLIVTLTAFVSLVIANMFLWVCAFQDIVNGTILVLTSIQLVFSFCYIYAYFTNWYPGIFQKLSVFMSTISVYAAFIVY